MPTKPEVYAAVGNRSGGICELIQNGKRCGRPAGPKHHEPPRKMGGTDRDYTEKEIVHLCQTDHDNRDRYGYEYIRETMEMLNKWTRLLGGGKGRRYV